MIARSSAAFSACRWQRSYALVTVLLMLAAAEAAGQTTAATSGNVTVASDLFPNRDNTNEIRSRLFVEELIDPAPKLRLALSGFAEGLLANRPTDNSSKDRVTDGVVGLLDASVSWKTRRLDLLAGFTRISWGRLDELQPTDVVNPLDASRFFFESRSEARLPVGLVRLRGYLTENTTIEGVYVPFFRRGRFDQLDEPTSPFNVEQSFSTGDVACLAIGCPTILPIEIRRREPPATWTNGQGGLRLNGTTGKVDWSVSAYRGLEPFGLGTASALHPGPVLLVDIVHPRFTMLGGDFETVRGEWGVRGELAAFIDKSFQGPLRLLSGSSIDAGVGVDRQAGAYRVSATALFHREMYDDPVAASDGTSGSRSNLSLILAVDRAFARERYRLRTFGVYTPDESNAFLRAIAVANLRDNMALEGSIGWFAGIAQNLIGRFADSDFVWVRLKYYF